MYYVETFGARTVNSQNLVKYARLVYIFFHVYYNETA